jgi:PPK2 family polyphosphate:nucleotide phosphotransferase
MKIDTKQFRLQAGESCDLTHWPTLTKSLYHSKKHYHKKLQKRIKQMSKLQRFLYASNEHSILVIFQAMDAAGKDGAIRHVMSGMNPQGCQVTSFAHPSAKELDHDFMWRTNQALPQRGRIGIFNRSYYEEVLIVKVHPDILASQRIPHRQGVQCDLWQQRYTSIMNNEQHLNHNGTQIIKIFLHLSKDKQRQRFLKRIDKPSKNWKFSDADINERKYWDEYMHAYQDCLSATSTEDAPWYVVPADDKKNARLIIASIMATTLASLNMQYPVSDEDRIAELRRLRASLTPTRA